MHFTEPQVIRISINGEWSRTSELSARYVMDHTDPLWVDCPLCNAGHGEYCRDSGNGGYSFRGDVMRPEGIIHTKRTDLFWVQHIKPLNERMKA